MAQALSAGAGLRVAAAAAAAAASGSGNRPAAVAPLRLPRRPAVLRLAGPSVSAASGVWVWVSQWPAAIPA